MVEKGERGSAVARIRGTGPGGVLGLCERLGSVPLPPYIEAARKRRGRVPAPAPTRRRATADRARYQTVYARAPGAVAAPTAGLHFTEPLLAELERQGHEVARLTLHVGPGTFRPVTGEDPREHQPRSGGLRGARGDRRGGHARAQREGRPIVAVGTTVVRTLETVARTGRMRACSGSTDLYLLPGERFQVVTDLDHQLPSAAVDAADAGGGLRRA